MKRTALLYLFLLLASISGKLNAQSIYPGITCPPNIDFENGNLSNWNFFRGTVSLGPVYSVTACPPVFSLHTLMSGTGTDYYGGFPIVDPGGGAYSLRLGKDSNNYNTDRAQYYVHVPVGANNYSLIYRYAVVLEFPPSGHLTPTQPSFVAIAYDSATGIPVVCAQDTFYGNSPSAGLIQSTIDSRINPGSFDVKYKPWSTISINLSGMGGKTIAVEFTAAGCTQSGHFGYGYVDMTCGLFAIDSKICDDTLATLTGPPGFSIYQWYDSATFTHFYGNTQIITMPIPDTATTFAVVVEPFVGFGCPDTLYTRIQPSFLRVNASNDTLVCANASVMLNAGATDSAIAMPLTYSWAPALGLSCTTCDKPTATPLATTIYTVSVTDKAGCVKRDVVKITLDPVTVAIGTVADTCFGSNNGSATATPTTGIAPFSYLWMTSPLQTSQTAKNLVAGTYSVTVTDRLGCSQVKTAKVDDGLLRNLSIVTSAGPTTCLGNDGYIVLAGFTAGTMYTFTYTYGGVPRSQNRVANATGIDTLKFLPAGVYDNITVDISPLGSPYCPFNIVGPITLFDPPTPPIPSVGNNGPLCIGDTLKLSAKDALPGVFFDWKGPSGFIWDKSDTAIANVDVTQAGYYTVTVTKNACSSSNTTKVIVKPYPVPSATGDTACTGSDISLHSSSANGADAYRWAGPNAYFSFEQNPVIHGVKMNAIGTYTVTTTLDGCAKTATTDILVVETPAAPTALTDTVYCQYDSPVPALVATGTNITWYAGNGNLYPGIPMPNTDVAGTTTWNADQRVSGPGSDPVVCISPKAKATVQIYAKHVPTLSTTDTVICTGNEITFATGNLGEDNNGIRWTVTGDNDINDVNPLHHAFDAIGTYTISVTPMHKYCPNPTLTQVVHVFPYPILNLGPDTAICIGSKSITLADNINKGDLRAKWLWNTNETTPSIVVTKPGVYFAKVLINGCPVSDTVTVLNDCYIDVPNAFTPNGDGSNDYFLPRQFLTKGLTGFKMEIYNRWGQIVFTSNSLNGLGWDGKFNNVPQPEGVYVFRVEANFKDGQIETHTGNLTLLR